VYGQVKVAELRSQGVVAGQIDAESVELSGHVNDQTVIRASSLQVTLNQNGTGGKLQVTFGNCDLEIGKPTGPRDKSVLREDGKQRRQGMDLNSGPAPEA